MGVAYIIITTKSDTVTVECHRSLVVGSCSHRHRFWSVTVVTLVAAVSTALSGVI